MKRCNKCASDKDEGDFFRNKRMPDGLEPVCKICKKVWNRHFRNKFREKRNAELKVYYKENRPRHIWNRARYRCTSQKHVHYKYYGGKGVKFLLTLEEVVFIWERDGGARMDRPSIDRIDSNGNYVLHNCRIIETVENIKRMNAERVKSWS